MAKSPLATTLCSLLAGALLWPAAVGFAAEGIPPAGVSAGSASGVKIRHKLEHIIIPKLDFRDATIREVIDFLKKKSVDLDQDPPAGERGLNMALKLEDSGGAGAGAQTIPGVVAADGPDILERRITVSLTNISLLEALKYVTGLANLKFKIEPQGVAIVLPGERKDVLITKEWKIPRDLIPQSPIPSALSVSAATGGKPIVDREVAKNWLIANGVSFDGEATAFYITKSSRLLVRNTQDQLDLVETIVNGENSVTGQVEIECKFVEIEQGSLKELRFDALLEQFNLPATKNVFISGGDIARAPEPNPAALPFVPPGADAAGETGAPVAGSRAGGLVSRSENAIETLVFPITVATSRLSSGNAWANVFTDLQFQQIMRTLNRKKGVSFLSVPKVTVKNGQRTVIEVVRDFRHATNLLPPQIMAVSSSAAEAVSPEGPAPSENREIGVTLEVIPVVGPDGYTVDLNFVAERFQKNIELIGAKAADIPPRKAQAQVSVYDGSTVVLGGILREDLAKEWGDKTLLAVDEPIIGPDLDGKTKRNFLIFVGVRLINATSVPVGADDNKNEVSGALETPPAPPPSAK